MRPTFDEVMRHIEQAEAGESRRRRAVVRSTAYGWARGLAMAGLCFALGFFIGTRHEGGTPGGYVIPVPNISKGVSSGPNRTAAAPFSAEGTLEWLLEPDAQDRTSIANRVKLLEDYLASHPDNVGLRWKLMTLRSLLLKHPDVPSEERTAIKDAIERDRAIIRQRMAPDLDVHE